jgi:hypothetical protein
MLAPFIAEFKEKYCSRSLENIQVWYFFYIASKQIMLQLCEFCSVSTDAPGRTTGFCFDDQVVSPCRK